MQNENDKQNVDIAILNNKLENICEIIEKGFNRSEGIFKQFEEKNCRKHQEILATANQALGRTEERIKQVEEKKLDREWFDNFLESNNRKLKMIDDRISEEKKKIEEDRKKLNWAIFVLSTIVGALVLVGNNVLDFLFEFLKK